MDAPEPQSRPRTVAEKLRYLFDNVHPPGRGRWTLREVVDGIAEQAGPDGQTVSLSYLSQLRDGVRDNPTVKHLEAIAGFFGVTAAYFLDEERARRVEEQLDLLVVLRDQQARSVALRTSGLSPHSLDLIGEIIENARRAEGLTDEPPESPTSAS